MSWIAFKKEFLEQACFSVHQAYAWQSGFDRNNLARWVKKGYLEKLRRGWYAFSDYKGNADIALYFAGRIYKPSYISLHSALSFYGVIPESVVQITSVTALKTVAYSNSFGEFSYKSLKPELIFGYYPRELADGRRSAFATCEKALLDLLYLYPFYDNVQEIEGLRLDRELLAETIDRSELYSISERFHCYALSKRLDLMCKVYEI